MYDRSKLQRSILKALHKRQPDIDKIEKLLNELENDWASNKKWITSKRIWKDVLNKLKDVDDVAYIRFASIYHNFDNVNDFIKFIKEEFE